MALRELEGSASFPGFAGIKDIQHVGAKYCDQPNSHRMIQTVQDKPVLKLNAARALYNHHTVAGRSLPLSFYPLSLSLSHTL